MALQEDFELFLNALFQATQAIAPKYFRLPIVDGGFQDRERPYCYELYHHLRLLLPVDFQYTLSGEVDKRKHPIIHEACGGIIPDFLLHNPGFMGPDDNLAIMEVKPIMRAYPRGPIEEDIEKIHRMTSIENGYHKGIILVFGEGHEKLKTEMQHYFHEHKYGNPENILLLFHHQAGQPAEIVEY